MQLSKYLSDSWKLKYQCKVTDQVWKENFFVKIGRIIFKSHATLYEIVSSQNPSQRPKSSGYAIL